jgi:hypothetical protein
MTAMRNSKVLIFARRRRRLRIVLPLGIIISPIDLLLASCPDVRVGGTEE